MANSDNYTSGFFNSLDNDRLYDADDFSRYLAGIITNGCFRNDQIVGPNDGLKVLPTEGLLAGHPPVVLVHRGKAYLRGRWLNADSDFVYQLDSEANDNPEHYYLMYFMLDINNVGRALTIEVSPPSVSPVMPTDDGVHGKYYMPLALVKNEQGTNPVVIVDQRTKAGVAATTILIDAIPDKFITGAKVSDHEIGLLQLSRGLFVAEFQATTDQTAPFVATANAWRNFAVGGVILPTYTPPVDVTLIVSGGFTGGHYPQDSAPCSFHIGFNVDGTMIEPTNFVRLGDVTGDKDPFSLPFSKAIPLTGGVPHTITAQMKVEGASKQQFDYAHLNGTMLVLPS